MNLRRGNAHSATLIEITCTYESNKKKYYLKIMGVDMCSTKAAFIFIGDLGSTPPPPSKLKGGWGYESTRCTLAPLSTGERVLCVSYRYMYTVQ